MDRYIAVVEENRLGRLLSVERIKRGNDVDRITTTTGLFFCKTYTKPWYDAPEETSYPVMHEAGAYDALRENGLPTPDIIRAELDVNNPLDRPYLLLKALEGVTIQQSLAQGEDLAPLLRSAGAYLRRMHAIEFKYPGYVCSASGPTTPPDPNGWRHTHWYSGVLERAAKKQWENGGLDNELEQSLVDMFESNREAIAAAYSPPRMLHGDCHVDQFFFFKGNVIGVVDMEVASSGAPVGDLVKFSIEASAKLRSIEWWIPFFSGYGYTPDFQVFKLRLLCCEYMEFKCQGWQGSYATIMRRLFSADSWSSLFACSM